MNSLYNASFLKKIRQKYRKNIKKRYGIVEKDFQRCHIFGLREAKYIELCLKLEDVNILVNLLVSHENVLFLQPKQHRLFEQNKLNLAPLGLNSSQETLLICAQKIRATKFRGENFNICKQVYDKLNKLNDIILENKGDNKHEI